MESDVTVRQISTYFAPVPVFPAAAPSRATLRWRHVPERDMARGRDVPVDSLQIRRDDIRVAGQLADEMVRRI